MDDTKKTSDLLVKFIEVKLSEHLKISKTNHFDYQELQHKKDFLIKAIIKELKINPELNSQLSDNIKSNLEKSVKEKMKEVFSAFALGREISKKQLIYEAYKILNPKRIAGETLIQNYLNNYITGGIKKATRYEKKNESKKIPPKHLKNFKKKFSSLHIFK